MAVDLISTERRTGPREEPYWDNWDSRIIQVDEHNRAAFGKLDILMPISQKTSNSFCVRPRDSELLIKARASFFKEFHMGNTSPTSWGCERFSTLEPGEKYKASTMLQVFSLSFAKDTLKVEPMQVYGFVAVRHDCEPLRNYIFNLPREQACTLDLDTSVLPLISPVRGMSVWNSALVEISLKVKENNKSDDLVLIDACVEFRWDRIKRGRKLKSRIDGPFGVFEMEYMFIKHGIEAVVEIDIPEELVNNHALIVAHSTGFKDEVTIYDAVIKEETRKISHVIVASQGGSLFFGLLATGARASAGYVEFKVKKSGSHEGHLLILKQSAMSDYDPHDILVVDGHLSQESRQLRNIILALPKSPKDPGVLKVPFKVTFSTMGYCNSGM